MTGPAIDFTDSPRTGDAAAPAAATSGNPDALVDRAAGAGIAPEEPIRRASDAAPAGDEPARTTAEASTRVAEEIAARTGREGETAPLGDPNAPQGSGPETDFSRPENRPAPLGKIRMSEFEAGPDHEQ